MIIIVAVVLVLLLVSGAVWMPWPQTVRCQACRQRVYDTDHVVTDDDGRVAHLTCPAARGSR